MQIAFHGAAQTVTGAQYLITVNDRHLLLECGLYQGKREVSYQRNLHFPYDPRKVDAVILSHAHIDHSGNLPNLVKQGFMGRIYCTLATEHLVTIMLQDSGHIHQMDARYVNKKRAKRGEPPIEPLYTQQDALLVEYHLQAVNYDESFEPIPGVTARLVEAGHILGSTAVVLDIEEKGHSTRLWYSGDIGRPNLPLVRDPIYPGALNDNERPIDYIIMECTYGDRAHRSPEQAYQELRDVVKRTAARGGKVIIPSFAVGRTQEIVYSLNRLIRDGDIPRIPIFVDSPLAVAASDIFRQHAECLDEQAQEFIRSSAYHSVLGFDLLTYIRSVEESKALNDRKGPMVIISASGMAETGRILHHLKNNIEDARNTILIVSWQAPETLGRRLAERAERVRIFGEEYIRRAEVVTIGGYSAHADQDILLQYALSVKNEVKHIFLVHGEEKAARAFRDKLNEAGIHQHSYVNLHERATLS